MLSLPLFSRIADPGSLNSDAFETICIREIPTKTVDEIKDYAAVFWERYTEIDGASTPRR